jgi:hypothetical protein
MTLIPNHQNVLSSQNESVLEVPVRQFPGADLYALYACVDLDTDLYWRSLLR